METTKRSYATLAVIAACLVVSAPTTEAQEVTPRAWVLDGGTLIDGTVAPPRSGSRIVISGERIACVGSAATCSTPPGASVMELDEPVWILPGLIDSHVHFGQTGWFDGRPSSMDLEDLYPYEEVMARLKAEPERYYRSYLCSGVTGVFDTGGYPWSLDLDAEAEHNPDAPHIAAAGPRITHAPPAPLNLPAAQQYVLLADEEAGRDAVRFLAAFGADAVKIWFLRVPEGQERAIDARVDAVAKDAAARGLPLLVHATTLREAKVALRVGAQRLVHGVDDQLVDDEFISLARARGTIYTPTLLTSDGYRRMYEAIKGVTPPVIGDPNRCVDEQTWERITNSPNLINHPSVRAFDQNLGAYGAQLAAAYDRKVSNLRRVHEAGIPIAMGTDAGNPGTMHGPSVYAELEAMQAAGMSPTDVILSATRNGALAMGRNDIGTIEEGKIADLIVVTGNPLGDVANLRRITHVMRAGKLRRVDELARP